MSEPTDEPRRSLADLPRSHQVDPTVNIAPPPATSEKVRFAHQPLSKPRESRQARGRLHSMDDDERLMRRALDVAAMGMAVGEMPIGAVVAVAGDVVAEAYTQERTQGRLLVHADLLAMDAADLALAGQRTRATLYVTLEPCLMCLGAAFTARMGRVVYALESPSDGGVAAFHHWDSTRRATDMPGYRLPAIESGLLREESAALLRDYAATAREGWARDWALACAGQRMP